MLNTKQKKLGLAITASVLAGELGAAASTQSDTSPYSYNDATAVQSFWQHTTLSQNSEYDEWTAYVNNGFSWQDALILAAYWGYEHPSDAKLKAGSVILNGQIADIRRILGDDNAASNSGSNAGTATTNQSITDDRRFDAFFSSGFQWNDAVVLANFWGLNDPIDAKLKAGSRILMGDLSFVQRVINDQPASTQTNTQPTDEALYQAFFNSGYNWDHAVILAEFWGMNNVSEAKLKAGAYILDGDHLSLKAVLAANQPMASTGHINATPQVSSGAVNAANLQYVNSRSYLVGDQRPFTGTAIEYFDSGIISAEFQYQNGLMHGVLLIWNDAGQLTNEHNFLDGQLEGRYRDWEDNGLLRYETYYQNGDLQGVSRSYENGRIVEEAYYVNNQLHGLVKEWNQKGELTRERNYDMGSCLSNCYGH